MNKIGFDLVEISRIKRLMDIYGSRFLNKIFTDREINYCNKKSRPEESFAARFAAKEAIVKCLGTGFRGIDYKEIEILNNSLGMPYCPTHNNITISLTHTATTAGAVAYIN